MADLTKRGMLVFIGAAPAALLARFLPGPPRPAPTPAPTGSTGIRFTSRGKVTTGPDPLLEELPFVTLDGPLRHGTRTPLPPVNWRRVT
jgi:hypothetical protein